MAAPFTPDAFATGHAGVAASCHVCGAGPLTIFAEFARLPRVTSDCRPWPAGGQLGLCHACGLGQKVIDAGWRAEADRVYADYQLYHQTIGRTEQVIFDQSTGAAAPRSELVLRGLLSELQLPARGRLLDLGCGTGPTLQAFSHLVPGWALHGFDPHLPDRARVERITGVERVFDGDLADLAGSYDLVTAIHVLEHVPDPRAFVTHARRLLGAGGSFVAQVPYFPDTPFDLAVTDHCTHFTLSSMARLLRGAGLVPRVLSAERLPKEITVVATAGDAGAQPPHNDFGECDRTGAAIGNCLGWLGALVEQAHATTGSPLGVFGTSIGGNWLLGALGARIEFFVDEDPGRSGTRLAGRPVVRPAEVPPGAQVLVPLPSAVAQAIAARLSPRDWRFILPPPFPAHDGQPRL
jgi:SAM-dependent methyltransferase